MIDLSFVINMVTSNIEVEISNVAPQLSALIDQSKASSEVITLTNNGEKSAVLLSIDAFEYLIGMWQHREKDLMPDAEFEQQFQLALTESGYDTKEKIIELVREVKREMYEERHQ